MCFLVFVFLFCASLLYIKVINFYYYYDCYCHYYCCCRYFIIIVFFSSHLLTSEVYPTSEMLTISPQNKRCSKQGLPCGEGMSLGIPILSKYFFELFETVSEAPIGISNHFFKSAIWDKLP